MAKEMGILNLLYQYFDDESGSTAIEYGMIAALIAVAVIGGANSFSSSVNARFEQISSNVNAL